VGNQFQLLLVLFYIPLALSSVPFSLLAKRFSPSRVLPLAMFGFGTVAMAGAATSSFGGMLACRMVLGVLEAAFLPLPSYYGSLFYTRRELSLRIACFFSAVNVAGAVSGLISFAVFQWRGKPLSGWRYLFLIEGAITVGMSVVLFAVLPRSVEASRFFSPDEKKLARARLEGSTLDSSRRSGEEGAQQLERFRWQDARAALRQPESWAFMLMALSFGVALTGAANFLPSMMRRLGRDTARANLLTVGPHLTAVASQLGATFVNNRVQQRGVLIACFAGVAAVAWVLLAALDLSGRRGADVGYFLAYPLVAGTFTPPPLVAEWIASNSPTSTGRALRLGMFATAIPVGGIISSFAFRAQDAPVYQRGLLTCASFVVLLALLAAGMRVRFARLNARMDRGDKVGVAPGFERPEWRHAL
jgi:MFS family permease